MNKIVFNIILLVFSIIVVVFLPMLFLVMNLFQFGNGIPLPWTSFSFLGSSTNYLNLLVDITFWYVIFYIAVILFKKLKK